MGELMGASAPISISNARKPSMDPNSELIEVAKDLAAVSEIVENVQDVVEDLAAKVEEAAKDDQPAAPVEPAAPVVPEAKADKPKADKPKQKAKKEEAKAVDAVVVYRSRGEEFSSFRFIGIRPVRNPNEPGHYEWHVPAADEDRADRHHHVITGRIRKVPA
jgi:hypothetical protein